MANRIQRFFAIIGLLAVGVVQAAPTTISLSSPAANAVFAAPASVTLSATVTPGNGTTITKVDFYQGATLIGSDTTAPYSLAWNNVPAGSYSLTAKATDSRNKSTTSAAVPIVVNTPPTVTLTSPVAGQAFTAPATVTITASASDSDGNITKVEFYLGTTLIGNASAAPYSMIWRDVPAGSYSLSAKATDNRGTVAASAPLNVNVASGGTAVYYLHNDHLNTPRLVMDEQNIVVWRNQPLAEPFGMAPPEEDPDGNGVPFTLNLRFPGQYFDKESNLHYNTFRDYNPQTGRYIQSDPIGLDGGINTYSYVGGNPVKYRDPRGLDRWGDDPYFKPPPPTGDAITPVCPECLLIPLVRTVSKVVEACQPATPQNPWPGNDPTKAPPGTEWRGRPGSTPGDGNGNYYNPNTTESYRPDLDHGDPIGPHWDYRSGDGQWYRIFSDGSKVPK